MRPIKEIKAKDLVAGITGYYEHGTEMTFGLVEIKAGSQLPEHKHPNEQITYMLTGQLDMIIGGATCILTPGMVQVIPSNVLHSAFAPVEDDAGIFLGQVLHHPGARIDALRRPFLQARVEAGRRIHQERRAFADDFVARGNSVDVRNGHERCLLGAVLARMIAFRQALWGTV